MASTRSQTLTIDSGQTVSSKAFPANDHVAFGMQMPAAFTGTVMYFQVSADNGTTFQDLYDATGTTRVSVTVTTSRSYDLPSELTAWTHFKLVSGSAEGADRSIVVIGKRP